MRMSGQDESTRTEHLARSKGPIREGPRPPGYLESAHCDCGVSWSHGGSVSAMD